MANNPSFNAVTGGSKTVLRVNRKEETRTSTISPIPASNGTRPHA